jgi:hypothetical protein
MHMVDIGTGRRGLQLNAKVGGREHARAQHVDEQMEIAIGSLNCITVSIVEKSNTLSTWVLG